MFCALHNAPTATETVTPTETVSDVVTQTIPGDIITVTVPFTITEAATAYSTSYYTVTTSAADTVYKRVADASSSTDLGPLSALSGYPESRISSACSCIVTTTPSAQVTVTETASAVTETLASTVTVPGDDEVVTVIKTTTATTTTTIQTAVPTYVAPPVDVCAGKPHRLCCQGISTVTNLGSTICGYTPTVVGEQLGSQCIEGE